MTDNPFAPQPVAAAPAPAAAIQPTPQQAAGLLAQQQQAANAAALNLLSGIENAPTYGAGQWFLPGEYRLELKEARIQPSSQHQGKVYVIAEFTILECALVDGDRPDYQPGATVTSIVDLGHASAKSNIKGMVMALVPTLDEAQITNQTVAQLCGADQPASGFKVRANAKEITTRAGNPFTKVTYRADESEPAVEAVAGTPPSGASPEDANPFA